MKSIIGWTRLPDNLVKKHMVKYEKRGIYKNSIFGTSSPLCGIKASCCNIAGKALKKQWCRNPRFCLGYNERCRKIKLTFIPATVTIEEL